MAARLYEIGINPIERNDHNSSLRKGFTISIANQAKVFIRKDEIEESQLTVDEFLK